MTNKKTAGFTLIEIIIVVCIIGILAAIAYPSYTASVQKSRRADARGALMEFAGAMERHFTAANNYCDVGGDGDTSEPKLNVIGEIIADCGDDTIKDTGTPTIFSKKSPVDGDEKYYSLVISRASPTEFMLSAIPIPQEAQANDECGTLTLTNTGIRTPSEANDIGGGKIDCW